MFKYIPQTFIGQTNEKVWQNRWKMHKKQTGNTSVKTKNA